MRRILILAALVTVGLAKAVADVRGESEALAIARAMWSTRHPSVKSSETDVWRTVSRTDAITLVGREGGGIVAVANDDRYRAVVAYADCDADGMGESLRWFLSAAAQSLNGGAARTVGTRTLPAGVKPSVSKLLATTWDQESPYYNLCPTVGGRHCLTGCVATAMAQVMRYYRWPVSSQGTGRYLNPSGTDSIDVTLGATYDWDHMLDSYTSSASAAEQSAVARLMYDCGAAAKMDYAVSASGAYMTDAARALRENFGYHARYYGHKDYDYDASGNVTESPLDPDKWDTAIYMELSDGHPVIYAGMESSGSQHCFVLDGYDANGLVHVNWGFSGDSDGYVDLSVLPMQSYGSTYTYCWYNEMVMLRTDTDVPYNLTEGEPLTAVVAVEAAPADGRAEVYDASGRRVAECDAAALARTALPGHGVYVVRQGTRAYKIMR